MEIDLGKLSKYTETLMMGKKSMSLIMFFMREQKRDENVEVESMC